MQKGEFMLLDYIQLQNAVVAAVERFKLIKAKYPELKPYPVLSSRWGQVDLTDDVAQILKEFPAMVVDSSDKTRAIGLCDAIRKAEKSSEKDSAAPRLRAEFRGVIERLRFDPDTNVEIRLGCLVFTKIRELKQDPLIDRDLTMQSDASIRIIVGTIKALAGP